MAAEDNLKLADKRDMLIIDEFLSNDRVCLKKDMKELKENRTTNILPAGETLTAYGYASEAPAMIVIIVCSLMLNGPGLSGMPKREIFGSKRAQALPMGRLNTCATIFSHKIRFKKAEQK